MQFNKKLLILFILQMYFQYLPFHIIMTSPSTFLQSTASNCTDYSRPAITLLSEPYNTIINNTGLHFRLRIFFMDGRFQITITISPGYQKNIESVINALLHPSLGIQKKHQTVRFTHCERFLSRAAHYQQCKYLLIINMPPVVSGVCYVDRRDFRIMGGFEANAQGQLGYLMMVRNSCNNNDLCINATLQNGLLPSPVLKERSILQRFIVSKGT